MSNGNTLEVQANNQAFESAAFGNRVDDIRQAAATLTPAERGELQQTVVGKPAGYADQGYRHG